MRSWRLKVHFSFARGCWKQRRNIIEKGTARADNSCRRSLHDHHTKGTNLDREKSLIESETGWPAPSSRPLSHRDMPHRFAVWGARDRRKSRYVAAGGRCRQEGWSGYAHRAKKLARCPGSSKLLKTSHYVHLLILSHIK